MTQYEIISLMNLRPNQPQIFIPDREELDQTPAQEMNGEKISFSASAVVTRIGKSGAVEFLLVKELRREGIVYNQPTGGINISESPEQAVIREVLEETGYTVTVQNFLGNMSQRFESGTYIRFPYSVTIDDSVPRQSIVDRTVIDAEWYSLGQILEMSKLGLMRNKMVLKSIYRHLAESASEV
jgi:8-oxo-dGTP pyrophosphatase MutT (NUDIX family)